MWQKLSLRSYSIPNYANFQHMSTQMLPLGDWHTCLLLLEWVSEKWPEKMSAHLQESTYVNYKQEPWLIGV